MLDAGPVCVCVCAQVKPDSSVAQRSAASGRLVLVMPKEDPQQAVVDVAYLRSVAGRSVTCAVSLCTMERVGLIDCGGVAAMQAKQQRSRPSSRQAGGQGCRRCADQSEGQTKGAQLRC